MRPSKVLWNKYLRKHRRYRRTLDRTIIESLQNTLYSYDVRLLQAHYFLLVYIRNNADWNSLHTGQPSKSIFSG